MLRAPWNDELVTAHPDDEVMFFAPALLCLGEEFTIHILCLSTGDYDGLGAMRKLELTKACAQLGIPPERVTVIDHDELRDQFQMVPALPQIILP